MKTLRLLTTSTLLTAALLSAPLQAETGPVDFGTFTPPTGHGDFVEVNIKGNLLAMASRLAEKEEPEAAEMLKSIHSIHVRVIGLDDGNRASTEKRLAEIRSQLEEKGWEKNVTVKQEDTDVAIYSKLRGQEAVEGLVVTVIDNHQQAVLVNIVGDIRPEKLVSLGEHFDIEPLKKLHEKIGGKGKPTGASGADPKN